MLKAKVRLVVDRSGDPPRYAVGEQLKLGVRSDTDLYLYLIDVRANGTVSLLFPDAQHRANHVRADTPFLVPPAKGTGYRVRGPIGANKILAIGTREPVDHLNTPEDLLVERLLAQGIVAQVQIDVSL